MNSALDRVDQLHKIGLFAELDQDQLERVAKSVILKRYPAGQTLFVSGMASELMYVVLSGALEIYTSDIRGEHIITRLGAGEFVGEGSLIIKGPRSTNCRVVEDCEVLILTRQAYHDLVDSNPAITTKLLTAFLKTTIVRLRQGHQRPEIS